MSTGGYDRFTKIFHWLLAVIIFAEYIFVWMIPEGTRGPNALASYHMSFGMVVLVLMLVRIAWRARVNAHSPAHSTGSPTWQRWASAWTHGLLYVLLVALALTGWLWISANGWNVTLFGAMKLPHILPKNPAVGAFFSYTHEVLATAVLALVIVHVVAALYHWVVVKDRMMQSIWP